MSTRKFNRIGVGLASLMLAGGITLSAIASTAVAAERPSEAQILDALKPTTKMRSLSSGQQDVEERHFIDQLRTVKSRSLTTEERHKVATIAKQKPSIDLEVYFNYNSAEIAPRAVPDLTNLGRALSDPELRGSVFLVSGHTDAKGSDEYNQRLSERRAEAVKRFLVQKFGLPEDSLVAAGYGEEQLKNTAAPFAGENRRVQIANLRATNAEK